MGFARRHDRSISFSNAEEDRHHSCKQCLWCHTGRFLIAFHPRTFRLISTLSVAFLCCFPYVRFLRIFTGSLRCSMDAFQQVVLWTFSKVRWMRQIKSEKKNWYSSGLVLPCSFFTPFQQRICNLSFEDHVSQCNRAGSDDTSLEDN